MDQLKISEIVSTGDCLSPRRDELSVLWAITKVCNYHCSYCVYFKSAAGADYSSREELLRAADVLIRLGRPGYQITLYGGEPTLHPHFQDLLDRLVGSQAPIDLRMYTNASRSAAFFERMAASVRDRPFGVILSLHHEFANFERFKRVLEVTAGGGLSVGISVMVFPALRDKARRYLDELLAMRARVPFFISINLPYAGDGDMSQGVTAADLAWIEDARAAFARHPMPGHLRTPFYTRILASITTDRHGRLERLAREESLQFLSRLATPSYTGFYCCSGTNVLFIEEDGAVRGGVCSASTPMGNIFRASEIALVQAMKVVRCAAPACGSIENIPLPKFRQRADAEACLADAARRAKALFYRAEAERLERPGGAADVA